MQRFLLEIEHGINADAPDSFMFMYEGTFAVNFLANFLRFFFAALASALCSALSVTFMVIIYYTIKSICNADFHSLFNDVFFISISMPMIGSLAFLFVYLKYGALMALLHKHTQFVREHPSVWLWVGTIAVGLAAIPLVCQENSDFEHIALMVCIMIAGNIGSRVFRKI